LQGLARKINGLRSTRGAKPVEDARHHNGYRSKTGPTFTKWAGRRYNSLKAQDYRI
jgi:hypothetical protein